VHALALAVLLLGAPARGAPDDAQFVEAFLKIEIARLPPEQIDRFVALDPAALPEKLRERFKARRLELRALKDVAAGKKKGNWRMPDAKCEIPHDSDAAELKVLGRAGYVEVEEEEVRWVSEKTKCSERDMLCEFTLKELDFKTKDGKSKRRYFLYCRASCDPLMVLIGNYRAKVDDSQSHFFGLAGPTCSH
jgi:hypothetical protein